MTRVLVVLPFYGGSLPIGRYCASALEETGCLVDVFEAPEFFGAFSALEKLHVPLEKREYLENSFLQVVSEAIYAKALAFQADLVLCLAQAPISRQILRRLRKAEITTAMWFVEDYRLFTYWRAFAPFYDVFAVIQREPFLQELDAIGVTNTLYLPLAALPAFHTPLALSPVERTQFGAELSFLGAGYPNRRAAFTQFAGLDFKIWGNEWEGATHLAHLVQQNGRRISSEDAVRIYNATDININLHSSIHVKDLVSRGDFVNPRTFEVAACGAFQLVDERELMGELFAPDELATFTTLDELQTAIAYYRAHPEERKAIAARGRERVLRDHTYAQRMHQLLGFIKERFPQFGANNTQTAWPEGIPPALQEELGALLATLKLPPSASFDEVITALRSKSGQLTSTETALLFLDEWKKLYVK